MTSDRQSSLRGEVGKRGALAHVNAQSAFRTDMGESDFECFGSLVDIGGLHGGASDILLFVVGGAGGHILIDHESPVSARGDGIDAVGADGNQRAAKGKLRFGE